MRKTMSGRRCIRVIKRDGCMSMLAKRLGITPGYTLKVSPSVLTKFTPTINKP